MKTFGCWGEEKAVDFLLKKGFRILRRNYRSRFGEVDIIARQGKTIIFCEVKTRKDDNLIKPFEVITADKQAKIKISATEFLQKARLSGFNSIRFDVITVVGDEKQWVIEHIENAFD